MPQTATLVPVVTASRNPIVNEALLGSAILTGGNLDDTFKLANGKGVTGKLNGGAGTDTLDYTAYTTAIVVNLATQPHQE